MLIRPGTDGALACAVMHCLFRDGKADWDYLEQIHRRAARTRSARAHARSRNGRRAITGCPVETIEAFARLVGENKRAYFRLGYGFSRSRNGAGQHARRELHRRPSPAHGATRAAAPFTTTRDIFHFDKSLIEGSDVRDPVGPHARPVAHRRDPDRRPGRAARRSAGHRDADPEHQSGFGRARIRRRSSAALRATICSSACTSSS